MQTPSSPLTPHPAVPARLSGSKSKPLLIALAVLVIAGYLAYRYWTGTPQYSLWQARQAAAAHDLNRFEKYVVIESCIAGLIDDVMAESMQQAAKAANVPDNPWAKAGEKFGGQMAQQLVTALKPTLVAMLRQQVREYIEKGSMDQMADNTFKMGISPKDLQAKAREQDVKYKGLEYVRKDGAMALVGLAFTSAKGPKPEFTIELRMRRTDHGWQVSRWNNAAQLMRQLVPVPTPLPTAVPTPIEPTPTVPTITEPASGSGGTIHINPTPPAH